MLFVVAGSHLLLNFTTLCATFRAYWSKVYVRINDWLANKMKLTVSVESVHPSEVLLTSLARIRSNVQMQLLVPLAIVLTSKAFLASRPLASIRLLLRMRAQMSLQIEVASESTSTARNRAFEVGRLFASFLTSIRRARRRHVLLRHSYDFIRSWKYKVSTLIHDAAHHRIDAQ